MDNGGHEPRPCALNQAGQNERIAAFGNTAKHASQKKNHGGEIGRANAEALHAPGGKKHGDRGAARKPVASH